MKDLFAAAEKQVAKYEVGLQTKTITLKPIKKEDQSIAEDKFHRQNLFTVEAAYALRDKMVADGFIITFDCPSISDYAIYHLTLNDVKYEIVYDIDNSEKCAQLKKQLADLGCHY